MPIMILVIFEIVLYFFIMYCKLLEVLIQDRANVHFKHSESFLKRFYS